MRSLLAAAAILCIAALAEASVHIPTQPTQVYPPQCVQRDPMGFYHFIASNTGNECQGAPAFGLYNASRFQIGWDQLNLETSSDYPDQVQAYAAGYFEGAATWEVVLDFYANMIAPVTYSDDITQFFNDNQLWMLEMLLQNNRSNPDPMWIQVDLLLTQFDGFLDGLNSQIADPTKKFTKTMLLYLSSQGDLLDLSGKYPASSESRRQNDWRRMSKHQFELWLGLHSHCSALVRVASDRSDLIFSHATWQTFTFALRIYKTLTFRYKSANMQTIQFSSYPATFVSTDDFHVLDSGLVVMETSLNVFNTSIYSNVAPQSLLSWIRVMSANRLATDGKTWRETFSRYNSGTYNNQWMIVNLNRFTPHHQGQLQSGLLTVVEQMPGWIMHADKTEVLQVQGGYWPSYNVPSFPQLFNYSGYPEAIEQQGPEMLDYDNCVRAQIFRQRAPNISTVEAAKFLAQYNDYKHDPISQGNPLYAIASRVDLTPPSMGQAQTFGAIDAKVSSYSMYKAGQQVYAWSGPTPQQPIFSFLITNATVLGPHDGVPNTFDFGYQLFQVGSQRGK